MRAIYNAAQDKVAKITSKDFTTPKDFETKFAWEGKPKKSAKTQTPSTVSKLAAMFRL